MTIDREKVKQALLEALKSKARNSAIEALTKALTSGDLLILSGFGIDGKNVMLDIFIEECTKLKEEEADEIRPG